MKKILYSSILMCLFFVACKKKDTTPVVSTDYSKSLINTYSYYENGKQFFDTLLRDNLGRLIEYDEALTSSKTTLEYVSPTLIVMKIYTKDTLTSTSKMTLNSSGYVSSTEITENNQTQTSTSFYDSNGFSIDYETDKLIVLNENVVTRYGKFDTTYYKFDLTKLNTISLRNLISSNFNGKENKNLVVSEKVKANETKYSYEFDTKNRVTKKTTSYFSNGIKEGDDYVEMYTYVN